MQNNYSNKEAEYAGFWVRFSAYMIDCILVFFALLIIRVIMLGVMSAVKGTVLGGNILFHYNLKDIVLYVLQVLYFILCTYYTGTTLGKKAMNLRVVCADREEDRKVFERSHSGSRVYHGRNRRGKERTSRHPL